MTAPAMFRKVLIANRGAVAARVVRALRALGVASVAVYSDADADLPYVREADEAYVLGPATPQHSYLNITALLGVLQRSGADAVHPGYGFLSENADFARAVEAYGATFIGPKADWIDLMGHKTKARDFMAARGIPVAPSSPVYTAEWADLSPEQRASITGVGYPVLVKPAAGGGGIGMLPAHDDEGLARAWDTARSLAQRSFSSVEIYVERLVQKPRHVEFQVLADRYGQVRVLFERDCSVQRRHQKVLEEAPAPGIPRDLLDATCERIAQVLGSFGYDVIGTVEMLYDTVDQRFHFLEMNTRLQVEHAVTEEVTGVDLVCAQVRLAAGQRMKDVLPIAPSLNGHAIEARLYAEDPQRFFPSPGPLTVFELPQGPGLRTETGYAQGAQVTPYYDPMLAKIIAHGQDRETARQRLLTALESVQIQGVKTNLAFLLDALRSDDFVSGQVHTEMVRSLRPQLFK